MSKTNVYCGKVIKLLCLTWSKTNWPSEFGLRAVLAAVQVFRVASVCLGSPPDTICWEYRDKDKNFHRMGPLTPQEFYREHVKPLYNIQDKVRTFDRGHWHVWLKFATRQTFLLPSSANCS